MCMRSYLLMSSFETNFSQCLANLTRNPSLSISRSPRIFLFLKKTLLFLSTVEEELSPCHGMRERRRSVVKARKKREEGGGFGVLGLILGQGKISFFWTINGPGIGFSAFLLVSLFFGKLKNKNCY